MPIPTPDFHETVKHYERQGWFFAGSGTRAKVLLHPHVNMAVKISLYDGEWSNSASDGYLWYVRNFRKHPSPHVPRIYSFFLRPSFSIVYLEKLNRIEPQSTDGCEFGVIAPHPDSFIEFCCEVRDFARQHALSWDGPCYKIGTNDTWNCMARADGTRVLTDPFCGRYSHLG